MLEKLVHAGSVLLPNQHHLRITIPNGISYEIFQTAAHPGWDWKDEGLCKAFGQAWYAQRRSAILIVPSMPARVDRHILINPLHPDTAGIAHDSPEPVWWDDRLYG
jgi:RES domain-containing protein